MTQAKEIKEAFLTGERALFMAQDLKIDDTIFDNGESPLKESRNIELYNCMFKWKYPLWYANNIQVIDTHWFEMARAGVWYTNNIVVKNALIEAPKNFRRAKKITLENVTMTNAQETLWQCEDIKITNLQAHGDYFLMNSHNIEITDLNLVGNYPLDGAQNVTIKNSKFLSKDAFWNCQNVTIYDSFISGEYLGWNSKNLTLINCTIESLQGMCYIDNLKLINCKLLNTTLAFEYSKVDAQIVSKVDSILNPTSGRIIARQIDKLIMEKDKIDPSKTIIICEKNKDE